MWTLRSAFRPAPAAQDPADRQRRAGQHGSGVRPALCSRWSASIAPERLLRASLIQILFSIRSERQLMEQMQYNLLFRWFVGLGIDDPVWVPTVFTKNRDRLLTADIARKFLAAILAHREVSPLLSDEHFSVDGTLVKAWASMKSFQPKPEAAPSGRRQRAGRSATSAACRRYRNPCQPIPDAPTSPIRCPSRRARIAMPKSTSAARSGRTRRTPRSPIPRRGSTGSRPAPARGSASSAIH